MSTYEISQSSLLSLKAEIVRKQQEFANVKVQNAAKLKAIKKKTPLELKNKGLEDRLKNDISDEDEDLLKKSRSALEKKSKLYDKLVKEGGSTEKNGYLVKFDEKREEHVEEEEDIICNQEDYDDASNSEDEWVEYVDSLGRTRTCLKKDVKYFKEREKEFGKEKTNEENAPISTDIIQNPVETIPEINENNELLSGDMRREMLRQQWEKEEEELKQKNNIHYQDILFDEARNHGVGYYSFSKDEEERKQQQAALHKLRKETEVQQKRSHEIKMIREQQLGMRIKAAKNRKRARMGLPPLEDEPETPETENKIIEEPIIDEAKQEEEIMKQKLLEEARKNHVRPWDVGKKGGKDFEYTQEEWVDKQRSERVSEFAPPSTYKRDFRGKKDTFVPMPEHTSLRFSSKKAEDKRFNINPKRSWDNIYEKDDEETKDVHKTAQTSSTYDPFEAFDDIAPCERRNIDKVVDITLENKCSQKKFKNTSNSSQTKNLEDSIESGLKYLRQQSERKESIKDSENLDMFQL